MDPECPTNCPVNCNEHEMHCPGDVDSNGCKMPDTCMWNDPYSMCPSSCPVFCGEDMMMCPGGMDAAGCMMPETCVPMDPNCPTNCPVNCNQNEMMCPGHVTTMVVKCQILACGMILLPYAKTAAPFIVQKESGLAPGEWMIEVAICRIRVPPMVSVQRQTKSRRLSKQI